jgi:hypothetical protein
MFVYAKADEKVNRTHATTGAPMAGTGPEVTKVLCDAGRDPPSGRRLGQGMCDRPSTARADRSLEVFTHMGEKGALPGSSAPGENSDVAVVTLLFSTCLFSYGSPGSRVGKRWKPVGENLKSIVIRPPDLWEVS